MKHSLLIISICLCANLVCAQEDAVKQSEDPVIIPSLYLGGPRVGFTYITGNLNNDFIERDINPFITQFGWQFETRYFTLDNGTAGLVEFVGLIGGLEQNLFLPSLTTLIGLRTAKGFEFGFGPNLSLSGAAFAFAVGGNFQSQNINFPINFAIVPSRNSVRFSLLFGFNARKSSGFLF